MESLTRTRFSLGPALAVTSLDTKVPDGDSTVLACSTPLTPKSLSIFNGGTKDKVSLDLADSVSDDSGAATSCCGSSSVGDAEEIKACTHTCTSANAELLPQVSQLIRTFACTTQFGCCKNADGTTKACCVAATAFIEGAVMAASARHGVAGVLDIMQTKFKWGTARCWNLCDCLKQEEVDCGSGMNVALMALRLAPSVKDRTTRIATVQFVQRWPRWQAAQRATLYDDIADPAEREFLTEWIRDDCVYHQCVGLVNGDASNQLRVWDFGSWHMPPTNFEAERAIVAIRVTLDDGEGTTGGTPLDWNGVALPNAQWVTLLPENVAAAGSLLPGVPNVCPRQQTLTRDAKKAILQSVFADHSVSRSTFSAGASPASAADYGVASQAPTVFIGGNHMSANPCPGSGVSRAIRLRFPGATTVAVDSKQDPLQGFNDVTFTRAMPVDAVMMPHPDDDTKKQHWDMVKDLLADSNESFYLPCSDFEIDRCADNYADAEPEVQAQLRNRVLCPNPDAVFATEKPGIPGAKAMGCFEIPPYMVLDADTHSQTDIEAFCKVRGYPVLVKGPVQGATVCHSWGAVLGAVSSKWGSGGYVQVAVTGFQMGLAYAAYDGEVTAAVLMEKTGYMGSKAWAGDLRPCPPKLLEGLKAFCKEHNWTGGGEIEYIEDMAGVWHAIDWNPRFPAWIFGGCYAGVNLPGALVQHALHRQTNGLVPFPADVALAAETANGGFTRTCVEIPNDIHAQVSARAGFPCFATTNYSKAGTVCKGKPKMNMLPPGTLVGPQPEKDAAAGDQGNQEEGEDKHVAVKATEDEVLPCQTSRDQVLKEVNRLIPANTEGMPTPQFILSKDTVRDQLLGHKSAVERALAQVENAPKLRMCLSVKTQPHSAVLEQARQCGYLGEVITTAEMMACLDAGWAPGEVVMNGPGKWYGDSSGPRSKDAKPTEPLACIFADSLADLETIIDRVKDDSDWLDAKTVGVRFSPPWVVHSRFGMNCKDPKVLLRAAELLNQLPERVSVGLHMHFAASKTGVEQWFGLARGYLRVAINFAKLLDHPPTVLDFGGGWPSHLLDSDDVHPHLVELLSEAAVEVPSLEIVQFEPGKSITERAGAVLTKVLEIREMERKTPRKAPKDLSSGSGEQGDDAQDEQDDDEQQYRAAVVDACISDMGSLPLHVHPLLWQEGAGAANWSTPPSGKDQLWGSICMEFDILGSQFELPETAAVGDHVLIAFTGAYDMTMAYDFADGKERDIIVV